MLIIMNASVTLLSAALLVLAATIPIVGQADGADDIKNCYNVRGEARYGALAYKHVVIVTNRCELTLQCEVWTDVDPTPRHPVTVGPKGEAEVLVRNNSPARAFTAYGECKRN
jgi:hypothetical protein